MWKRCGGFPDYFRDRGAKVLSISTVLNTVTFGLTTPAGADAILGGEAIINQASGEAVPIVNSVFGRGLTFGLANSSQGILEDAWIEGETDLVSARRDFGVGFTVGATSRLAEKLVEADVAAEATRKIEEYLSKPKIIGGLRLPTILNIPTSTTSSKYVPPLLDGFEAGIEYYSRLETKLLGKKNEYK